MEYCDVLHENKSYHQLCNSITVSVLLCPCSSFFASHVLFYKLGWHLVHLS